MILARFLLAFVALSSFVSADTIYVDVNQDCFSPNISYGNPGDLVSFIFNAGDTSVSEATARLNDPCNTEGGFDSGVQQNPGETFTIIISTYNSIYVFSSPQCTQGMVMIINPGPNDSLETYMSVAEASGGSA